MTGVPPGRFPTSRRGTGSRPARDEVVLEYGQRIVCLEGGAAERLVPALLPLLDGTRTWTRSSRVLGEPARPAVENGARPLAPPRPRRGTAGRGRRAPRRCRGRRVAHLAPPGRRPLGDAAGARGCSVAVVGDAPPGSRSARLLRLSGVERRAPNGRERRRSRRLRSGAGDELPRLRSWNAQALEAARQPWLQVLPFDGRYATVGPLYLPGDTCCYECFRLRRRPTSVRARSSQLLETVPAAYPAAPCARRARAAVAAPVRAALARPRRPLRTGRPSTRSSSPDLRAHGHHLHRVPRCAPARVSPTLRRRFPGTRRCRVAGRLELRPVRRRPPAATLPRLRSFVSPLTGVVRSLARRSPRPTSSGSSASGASSPTAGRRSATPLESYTGSEHWSRDAAEAAAIGEALERYSGSYVPPIGSWSPRADRAAAAPSTRRGSRCSRTSSTRARRFRSGRFGATRSSAGSTGSPCPAGACLPPRAARLHAVAAARRRGRVGHATSSGLACAATLEEAILAGLLELVERDAFMLAWHNRLSLPLLDWSGDRRARPARPPLLRALRSAVLGRRPERLPRRADGARRRPRSRPALSARSVSAPRARRRSPTRGARRSPRRSPSVAGCATGRSRSRSASGRPRRDPDLRRPHALLRRRGARAAGGVPRRSPERRDVARGRAARGRRTSSS